MHNYGEEESNRLTEPHSESALGELRIHHKWDSLLKPYVADGALPPSSSKQLHVNELPL